MLYVTMVVSFEGVPTFTYYGSLPVLLLCIFSPLKLACPSVPNLAASSKCRDPAKNNRLTP